MTSPAVVPLTGVQYLRPAAYLQEQVLTDLQQDKAHFLVPKSKAQFWHLLHGHGGTLYGVTHDGRHAAQIIVRQHIEPYELKRTEGIVPDDTRYLLVQGALTHPACRGLGLMHAMLTHISAQHPDTALLARVVPDNSASWRAFIKAGYAIVGAEADPDDERRVFYLYRATHDIKASEERSVDWHDFTTIQQLCRDNWHGRTYDKESKLITFVRPE